MWSGSIDENKRLLIWKSSDEVQEFGAEVCLAIAGGVFD
jgi:hypothetical protein